MTCPNGVHCVNYLDGVAAGAALVDFTAFLCFFTLLVVDFVSVVDLVVSCLAAAKAEPSIIERASAAVIVVFMAVSFLF
jgi:hypothetical protein